MRLSGIACTLPSQIIRNDELLDLVAYHTRGLYRGDIDALLESIRIKLDRTGIVSRYWRASAERPITLLTRACEAALKQANLTRADVDFVIYAAVDRGFAEPANACFVAKTLRMNNTRTFDVVDACLGWATATEIAQALFGQRRGNVALIVTAEFPMRPNGSVLPECFSIGSDAELEWKFPAFTLGEAATATILIAEGREWRYFHESHNELADLCTVRLGPPNDYADTSERFGISAQWGFRAYGSDLARHIYRPAVRVLRELVTATGSPQVVFPHSVIGPYIDLVAKRVNPALKVFSTFQEFGNCATSSLPSSIVRARQRRLLKSSDIAIGWAAASGVKVSAFEIITSLGGD